MSEESEGTFTVYVSKNVSELSVSISALLQLFNKFFATIQQARQFSYTQFEPGPLFSTKVSNSASTAARTTVSCLNSARTRGAARERPGLTIGTSLRVGGGPFFGAVF